MTARWPAVMVGDRRQPMPDGDWMDPAAMPPQVPSFAIPFPWPWSTSPALVWAGASFAELDGGSFDYDSAPAFGALLGGTPGGTVTRPDWRDLTPWGAGGGTVGTIVGSNTLDLRHAHAAGSLQAATHSHGAGTLAGPSHSHGAGTLASQDHAHGAGSLQAAAHSHSLSPTTETVVDSLVGGVSVLTSATVANDGPHSVSGSTASAGAAAVTGSTATGGAATVTGSTDNDGPHSITGDTGAASWTDLATPDAVSKLPKRALVRWFVRVSV